ncbi:MAG: acetyl-CoA carboxylase biotin carboxyl carrier protein subunit [Pseudomonas sp.]|uniref:acetyl-CoA carboxylase biotin carboxyl carrier protein n=1 Tax=Pseudomonas abieticivorans TaxID=2931382 RepID=UPI0020C16D1B|nr:acetyl-CoA carboxylase biotin carboxyl carrier protein subunit [Pseudomonas sp. PIA16]MDE1169396.1 acetyl-CoA carboxylase biotin carboxyl carrier protein subunit [Pseudomonas sp.]
MNPERIKALIDLMAESDLSELRLNEGDTQLQLLRDGQVPCVPAPPAAAPTVQAVSPATTGTFEASAALYGVLHLTPAPDQPAFVQVGDTVAQGQTLAVVEAMKMFHPLKAEHAGTVQAILAASGEEVAAGQPLFRLEGV